MCTWNLIPISLNVAIALAVPLGVLGILIKYFDRRLISAPKLYVMLTAVDFRTANVFETLVGVPSR